MKKLLSAVTICCLALGLTALPVLGQQPAKKGFHVQFIHSSHLIGADLFNTTGVDIGQVNDVVFDENSGGMMHAILAAGGFIGIGDKLTPVTWNAITVKTTNDGKINRHHVRQSEAHRRKELREEHLDKERPSLEEGIPRQYRQEAGAHEYGG
ncbi:MAG: PRC-barrel domain-containing protein [Chthoniobacterales bacterium]|nr:PRC-barrel domain-containing protein [Chthoniobacterales bacterium]